MCKLDKCLFCGNSFNNGKCRCDTSQKRDVIITHCGVYDCTVELEESVLNNQNTFQYTNLILEMCLSKRDVLRVPPLFYYDESEDDDTYKPNTYNLKRLLPSYPITIQSKLDHALVNLSKYYRNIGDVINYSDSLQRLVFGEMPISDGRAFPEQKSIFAHLVEQKLLDEFEPNSFRITATGWGGIEELHKASLVASQGFIAMSYDRSVDDIKDAFISGIHKSGYKECVLSEKQHNNQIVPEMYDEIRKSKFIVADVSRPNLGAYYEVGYAHALGKEVIICCRKSAWDMYDEARVRARMEGREMPSSDAEAKIPHFDIAQRPIIIWDKVEDLIDMLDRRIRATIGAGPYLVRSK